MKKSVLVLMTLLALTACGNKSSASIEGQWTLASYNQTAAVADVETSIEFKDGQMNGNVGCNGFGGDYVVNDDKIEFGPIMSTMMFCEGPVGAQEMETLAVFQESAQFVIDGDTMMITSSDGESSITLSRK